MPKTKTKRRFKWFNPTITTRITIIYGGMFAFAILTASSVLFGNVWMYLNSTSRVELTKAAATVVEYIHGGGELTDEALKALNPNQALAVRVINLEDHQEYNSSDIHEALPRPPKQFNNSIDGRIKTVRDNRFSFVLSGGFRYSFFEQPVKYLEKEYLVQVSRLFIEEGAYRLFYLVFVAFNICGIIGAFFTSKYVAKKMLRPIVQITQAAERISIEDLSRRMDAEGPDDEIKQLTLTFNDMIERLETSFKKQSQFISDASHELRTPISVIQGYANLMDRWGKDDPAILQESIDSIKSETQHMAMLVKKLLFLAKDTQNKKQLHMEPLSLQDVAAEILRESGLREDTESDPAIVLQSGEGRTVIEGDYDLIKQLLWIFIENSIKYSRDKQNDIRLRIFEEGEYACISVSDQGIGILAEDLPFIFERFYRADKSRSNTVPGTGLGLSIADWIIKQHGAQAIVKSEVGQGTEITVKFKRVEQKNNAVQA